MRSFVVTLSSVCIWTGLAALSACSSSQGSDAPTAGAAGLPASLPGGAGPGGAGGRSSASAAGSAGQPSGGMSSGFGGMPTGAGGAPGVAGSAGMAGAPATGGLSFGGEGGGTANAGTAGAPSGTAGSGGAPNGGTSGSAAGGRPNGGSGGKASGGAAGAAGAPSSGSGGGTADPTLAKFSFFVTSYPALKSLSGKDEGFGGDLRFGKADGLSGADEICRQVAELGMPGAGGKQWRAFLSVHQGPGGTPVNARDRIGSGPWYDRRGRLVANNLEQLFSGVRPGGDPSIVDDLPTEKGEPNHYVGPNGLGTMTVDNHDTLTGSDASGRLRASSAADTCNDWTSTTASGRPWIGHSWPRSMSSGRNWVSDHQVPGCAAGIDRTLGGSGSGSCVGCAGGYGGFYCFALP